MLRRSGGILIVPFALLAGIPQAEALTVRVAPKPTVKASVHLGFSAPALTSGGYYYGVLVLRPYRHFTHAVPPACATSSAMQRTDYGYPQSTGRVALALTSAGSDTGRWCRGGSYDGAIYAVPHAPPCESKYPCYESEPYEPNPCRNSGGHIVCGVVALPTWSYPSPLPQPLISDTQIVARFSINLPGRTLRVLHLAASIYNVHETLDGVVSSHETLRHAGRPVGQDFSTCVPHGTGAAHCTGKYALAGGTITFAGTIPNPSHTNTLTITGGTRRYRGAEGSVLTEYDPNGRHAKETITFEG